MRACDHGQLGFGSALVFSAILGAGCWMLLALILDRLFF
jgi:hypothetical protein